MNNRPTVKIGAHYSPEGSCEFIVWAPLLEKLSLHIVSPRERKVDLIRDDLGYWSFKVDNISPGTRYVFELPGGIRRPDPGSFFQPEGVHGPSEVIDHGAFKWNDAKWKGLSLQEMIIYELHVGTFSRQGTFEAVIKRLPELKKLGINALELMPVAQFPGERNWGYDGTYPFAAQNSYGGVPALKKLVNACHNQGIAVILDVVYNHLGPEGNYLADFAPYFNDTYRTPWGKAVNFDGQYSDGVRNFFIENAIYWLKDYHVDALRLDAVHGIYDMSANHILKQLSESVAEFSRKQKKLFYLIAESDLNDSRVIRSGLSGGYGIDAQWCDDFHHCLHVVLTGENTGYYRDFGAIEQLSRALKEGFVYTGQYSGFRKRSFGNSYSDCLASQLIVFSQNHDQVGNRMKGERFTHLISFEELKLAASCVILSMFVPLIFMGEEYAEDAPFLYFVSHGDKGLIAAVREGRKKEFASFSWQGEPVDPQSEDAFFASKLDWNKRNKKDHLILRQYYSQLIQIRKTKLALSVLSKKHSDVVCDREKYIIILHRWHKKERVSLLMNFSREVRMFPSVFSGGCWKKVLDSSEKKWAGPGTSLPVNIGRARQKLEIAPSSCALYFSGG